MPRFQIIERDEWLVELCRGKSVLHLGCSDAPWTESRAAQGKLLHQHLIPVASRLTGVDTDAESIEVMREKFGMEDLHVMNAEELHPEAVGGTFDLVLACDVLEHLDNVGAFVGSCKRVLADEGRLVITTPNAYAVKRFIGAALLGVEHVHADHTAYFSPSTLAQIALRHDLEVTDTYGFMWSNPTARNRWANRISRLAMAAVRRPALADELAILARRRPD